MKKTHKNKNKKQFGGFGIDPSLAGLLGNLDLSNLNFGDVLNLGTQIGGVDFTNAIAADDPSLYTNAITGNALNQSANQAAIYTPEQIEEEAKRKTFLGIGKKRAIRKLEDENQAAINAAGIQAPIDLTNTLLQGNAFLNLFNNIGSFQKGGKGELGYSVNSPYRTEEKIVVPGNTITMANTDIPLMAIPDVGEPKVVSPFSGTHVFPGASSVTEVPMMARGGKKKKDKKKIPYYQEGGQPIPTAVQLEEGEIIATPELDLLDTAATESHKQMDSDVVTDIIRPEDYVFSDKSQITRKEADDLSFGLGAMLYKEGTIPEMPKEFKASDLFKEGEDEMSVAEYAMRIRKHFPLSDKDDVFSKRTNDANKAARLPYIASAVYINEKKRTKGKSPVASFSSTFVNKFEDSLGAKAGVTDEGRSVMAIPEEVQELQGGGFVDPLSGIFGLTDFISGLADAAFIAPARARVIREALQEDRQDINNLARTQTGYAGLGTLAQIAGYTAQDPTVTAPQYDSTQIDNRIRRVPKSLFDFAAGRLAAQSRSFQDSLFRNAGSFSQAVNAYAPVHASNAGTLATLGAQEVERNIALENEYRGLKQAFDDRQVGVDTNALNATRANTNRLTAGVAGSLAGGITNLGSIESNRQNELRRNNLQQTQASLNASQAAQQGVANAAQGLGTAASTLDFNQLLFSKPEVEPVNQLPTLPMQEFSYLPTPLTGPPIIPPSPAMFPNWQMPTQAVPTLPVQFPYQYQIPQLPAVLPSFNF